MKSQLAAEKYATGLNVALLIIVALLLFVMGRELIQRKSDRDQMKALWKETSNE